MKKLLSLLSVLTISGTAIPTPIAASPYEKEKNINSDINYLQTNNLETLNRNKRENNINLNVPNIVQADPDWCGPAIGESLLRYFNYNANNSNTGRGSRNFQSTLAYSMRTNPQTNIGSGTLVGSPLGTSVESWQYTINQIITTNNLNQGRQYSIQNIDRYYGNTHITNTIRNSLQNNMPVALAYRGVLPGSFSLHSNNTSNHFILINGISYNNQTINYMDPWTGQFGTFDINSFWLLVSRDDNSGNHLQSYLIYHDPNSQSENQIPNSNQAEPMDFFGQNKGYIYNFLTSCLAFHSLNNYRKIRSSSNDNQYCQNSTIDGKKITIWKILDEKTKGGSLQPGDTYIGTTSGVYLLFKRGNEINLKKFDDLDFLVKDIKFDGNGSAYVEKDNNGIVYHLNLQGWGYTEVDLNSLWQFGGNKNLPFPYNK